MEWGSSLALAGTRADEAKLFTDHFIAHEFQVKFNGVRKFQKIIIVIHKFLRARLCELQSTDSLNNKSIAESEDRTVARDIRRSKNLTVTLTSPTSWTTLMLVERS